MITGVTSAGVVVLTAAAGAVVGTWLGLAGAILVADAVRDRLPGGER